MNYIQKLQEHQLKATPQRLLIVENLDKHGHMNIDDLYIKLKKSFPSLSLATIYKNINLMIEKLFISEVKIPNQKSVYELTKAEHAHMVCASCGTIMDVTLDIAPLAHQAQNLTHFQITEANVVLSGLCPNCQ